MFFIMVISLIGNITLANELIEANNKNAMSYYYIVSPIDTDCSLASFESGWTIENEWPLPDGVSEGCDYQVSVYINGGLTNEDIDVQDTIHIDVNPATQSMMAMSTTSLNNDTHKQGMIFSVYSMLPEASDTALAQLTKIYDRSDVDKGDRSETDEFLLYLSDKELGDDIADLLNSYPSIIPDDYTQRLSMDIEEIKDNTFDSMVFDDSENPFSGRETHTHYYSMKMKLDYPDMIARDNFYNSKIQPSVDNLVQYPGSSTVFDYDWTLTGPSLINYPFTNAYWIKGYAFLNVPVSGNYTFGRRSAGGMNLSIEDVHGQTMQLLNEDAWALENKKTYGFDDNATNCSDSLIYGYKNYTQYVWMGLVHTRLGETEGAYYDMEHLPYQLYSFTGINCSNDYQTVWGQSQYLEAGQTYLMSLGAWSGWRSIELMLQVIGPDNQEIGLPISWLTIPDPSLFDTNTAWHNHLGVTERIEVNGNKSHITAASNYVWGQGTILSRLEWIADSPNVDVHFYLDNGEDITEVSSMMLETDIDANTVSIVKTNQGDLWAVLVVNSQGAAQLFTISSPLATEPVVEEILLQEGQVYLEALAISDYGERLALAQSDSIAIYEVDSSSGAWVLSSQVDVEVDTGSESRGLAFLNYYPNMLYVANTVGYIQKYLYDSNTNSWNKGEFNVLGSKFAVSTDTGEAIAVMNTQGVDIYKIDYDGNEIYQSSIKPAQDFDNLDSDIAIIADKVALGIADNIRIYSAINNDWSKINPNWYSLEEENNIFDTSLFWLANSGIVGDVILGHINEEQHFDLYRIGVDAMSTYNEILYSVVINNNSDYPVYSSQMVIAPGQQVELFTKRYETLSMNSGFYSLNYDDGYEAVNNKSAYSFQVYHDSQININASSSTENTTYIYCPSPENIKVSALEYNVNKNSQDFEVTAYPSLGDNDKLSEEKRYTLNKTPLVNVSSVSNIYNKSTGKKDLLSSGDKLEFIQFFKSSLAVNWSTTGYMNPEEPEPEVYSIDTPYCLLEGIALMEGGKKKLIEYKFNFPDEYISNPISIDPYSVKSSWNKIRELSFNHYFYKCSNCAISTIDVNAEQSYFTPPIVFSIVPEISTVDGYPILVLNENFYNTIISGGIDNFTFIDFNYFNFGLSYSGKNLNLALGETVQLTKTVSNLSNSVTTNPSMKVNLLHYDNTTQRLHIILNEVNGSGSIDWTFERKRFDPDDSDGDGIADANDNCIYVFNPDQKDSAGSTLGDVCEDSDGDGLLDADELNVYGTDPANSDTDGDGIPDNIEVFMYLTDPNDSNADKDGDGLTDSEEVLIYKTSPINSDTDRDGIPDWDEVNITKTDPLIQDLCHGEKPTIWGTPGNDKLTGTGDKDVIMGFGGDDEIYGKGGTDVICGGDGNDYIEGGDGADLIDGEDGDDTLKGNSGGDLIYGGSGKDKIYGGSGHDYIFGDDGKDTIEGGDDWDYIEGGKGDDDIKGNGGSDLIYGGSAGEFTGEDIDTLRMKEDILEDSGNDTISGGHGDDTIYGGDGDDWLDGGDDNDEIHGGDGNDTIKGGSSGDYLYGDAGDDTIKGQSGGDHIYGGEGTDTCEGGDGSDHKYECEK